MKSMPIRSPTKVLLQCSPSIQGNVVVCPSMCLLRVHSTSVLLRVCDTSQINLYDHTNEHELINYDALIAFSGKPQRTQIHPSMKNPDYEANDHDTNNSIPSIDAHTLHPHRVHHSTSLNAPFTNNVFILISQSITRDTVRNVFMLVCRSIIIGADSDR